MKIKEIREKLKTVGVEAYVVSHGNRFIGQDVLPQEHKLKALCGFSGSAGIAVVTLNEAFLLVDGRYELQARKETKAKEITVVDQMPRMKNVCDLLKERNITKVGYDAWCYSVAEMEFIKRRYREMVFIDVGDWLQTEDKRKVEVSERELRFAGQSKEEKCSLITDILQQQNADYFLLTSADSVSWLLNIYARDLSCSPIVRAYALISKQGRVELFADNLQGAVKSKSWEEFAATLAKAENVSVMYDAHSAPEKIKMLVGEQVKLIKAQDICAWQKAEKNPIELQGMINCHVRDGAALVKLFCWLEKQKNLTELDVVAKLHELRTKQEYFYSESFETIAGSGANGAIVHYQPSKQSNAPLEEHNLLLLDSGGQYFDGTTDVTRTIAVGEPTKEMIADFTAVLKAHINLALARFPVDTPGIKLDVLARAQMWQKGLDYKHGTGHGVACFGNVHEGPISISVGASDYGFKENMVTSNEPGVYKEGKYGIRIENLQYTRKSAEYPEFLEFVPLTKVPIDKRLIDKYLLSDDELAWLNKYHQDVFESLQAYLSETERKWLENACSPL